MSKIIEGKFSIYFFYLPHSWKCQKICFTLHYTFKIAMLKMIACIPSIFPICGMNKILCIAMSSDQTNGYPFRQTNNFVKSILSTSNCILYLQFPPSGSKCFMNLFSSISSIGKGWITPTFWYLKNLSKTYTHYKIYIFDNTIIPEQKPFQASTIIFNPRVWYKIIVLWLTSSEPVKGRTTPCSLNDLWNSVNFHLQCSAPRT